MLTALVATTYTHRREARPQTEVGPGLSRIELVVFVSGMLLLFLIFFSIAPS